MSNKQYLFARECNTSNIYLMGEGRPVPLSLRLSLLHNDKYCNCFIVTADDGDTLEDCKDFYCSYMDSVNWNNIVDQHNIETVYFANC